MTHDHYLPLFVGDFLASTATWTGPERGLYLQLLAFQWASGPLPCDHDRLALVLHYDPKEFKKLWPVMAGKFKNGDGALTNPKLEVVRGKSAEIHAARIARATAASNARWNAPSNAQALHTASVEHDSSNAPAIPSNLIQSRSNLDQSPREDMSRAKRSTGHRLPGDFELTPERRKFAEAEKINPEREFQKFSDYWAAISGAKGRKLDWDATWRNWCRNTTGSGPVRQTGREDVSDMVARLRKQADDAGEPEL